MSTTEQFEKNIQVICEKAEKMGASILEKKDAENILRLFDPETVEVIRKLSECFEYISKKIDGI